MEYRVEITKTAEADLDRLYRWVISRAPHQGANWFNGLESAARTLDRQPKRCRIAPESLDNPVRMLHYGRRRDTYRIFFTVDEARRLVQVLHIRHGARRHTPLKGTVIRND